jgi:hypothetical protein
MDPEEYGNEFYINRPPWDQPKHCYCCQVDIKNHKDIGGTVSFNFGTFPICIQCSESR